MPFDASLADRIRPLLARKRGFAEKRMFGGVGFLLDGNMCIGVWKDFLILRLGTDHADAALRQPGVREFDITGKPMRGWVMIDSRFLDADEDLREWAAQAVRFVQTLPGK
jgi:TfoX/Sxy family transcriptional regulator of competence genes